jgi:hypothetical protein
VKRLLSDAKRGGCARKRAGRIWTRECVTGPCVLLLLLAAGLGRKKEGGEGGERRAAEVEEGGRGGSATLFAKVLHCCIDPLPPASPDATQQRRHLARSLSTCLHLSLPLTQSDPTSPLQRCHGVVALHAVGL